MSTLFLLLFNSYIILRFRCIEEMIEIQCNIRMILRGNYGHFKDILERLDYGLYSSNVEVFNVVKGVIIDKIQVYDFISERLTDILISLRCNIDKDVEEDILQSHLKFRYNLHGYFQAQNHFIEEIKKFRY